MFTRNDKYNVNISVTDEDHSKFTDIINMAIAANQHNNNVEKVKDVLNEMTMYALSHFSIEETYMIKSGYPELQHHKEEHHGFTIKTIAYLNRVINGDHQISSEILEYLQQWQTRHIQVSDKKHIERFRKNGLK